LARRPSAPVWLYGFCALEMIGKPTYVTPFPLVNKYLEVSGCSTLFKVHMQGEVVIRTVGNAVNFCEVA